MTNQFRAGDIVEVLSASEIATTLDKQGCLDGLPFMPEMIAFTGKRFTVSKRAHKTCDTVHQTGGRRLDDCVHLDDLRCDGKAHNGCKANCLIFWKTSWLKPISPGSADDTDHSTDPSIENEFREELETAASQRQESGAIIYKCQATQLYVASRALKWWDFSQYIEDLTSRNTTPLRMIRVSFLYGIYRIASLGIAYRFWTSVYDAVQSLLGGSKFPARGGRVQPGSKTPTASLNLQPGETVKIKSHDEILDTLDNDGKNRGMRFDPEMVQFCDGIYTVKSRVEQIIHETTGEMITIKSPSVILDGVVCRSELSYCRLFCPRAIPSYWRECWLERIEQQPVTDQ